MRDSHAVCWRRLDVPGHDGARLQRTAAGWRISGTAICTTGGEATVLTYGIECDERWRTRTGMVRGFIGPREVVRDLFVDDAGRWYMNGVECPAVAGAVDLDLEFSPATKLLPVRRLQLDVGDEAAVRAAWLRFPVLTIEPLEQRYRRLDQCRYRYESARGAFSCDITVDSEGFVDTHGDLWTVERG